MQYLAVVLVALVAADSCRAQQISADEIVVRLMEHDVLRKRLSGGYTGVRRYTIVNRHLSRETHMDVRENCDRDGVKTFHVLSEEGSWIARSRVLRAMLETEARASQRDQQVRWQYSPENYRFELIGEEAVAERPAYVLRVSPAKKDRFLVRGKIWVDKEDFAVSRIEGAPAQNPSLWIKSVSFTHEYHKSGWCWFGFFDRSETIARLFGPTEIQIEYFDYHPFVTAAPERIKAVIAEVAGR